MKNKFSTLSLLFASVMISISGAFRLYIAYLFLGYEINVLNIIAGFLIIYSTYTLDRAAGGEEDKINRCELNRARKDIALYVCLSTFILGASILFFDNLAIWAFVPLIIGAIYTKGFGFGQYTLRLKGGLGMKNITVALSWGACITGIAIQGLEDSIVTMIIFLFFFVKTFVNTVMNDFRDVDGDRAVGLKTLPIFLGEKKTRMLMMTIHVFAHSLIGLAMLLGLLQAEPVILATCLLTGVIYISFFTKPKIKNMSKVTNVSYHLFYRWEFYLAAGLRTLWISV